MAIDAGDAVVIVVAAVPAEARVALVTAQAGAVLGFGRVTNAEGQERRRPLLAATHAAGMVTGRSVTGFALQLAVPERSVRIIRVGVRAEKQREHRLVVVTRKAAVSALAAVLRVVLGGSRAGGQDA